MGVGRIHQRAAQVAPRLINHSTRRKPDGKHRGLRGIAPTVSLCFLCALGLAMILAAPALAQTPDELEREAQAIDRMLMCPVCPAETIDQAQVEISFQMRAVIREMLAQGSSRAEILDYFVDRYGPGILAAPPKSGANLLVWILPIAGVAIGLGGLYLVVRAMTGRNRSAADPPGAAGPTPDPPPGDDPELSSYLEIVDRRLAARRGERPRPNPPLAGEEISGE